MRDQRRLNALARGRLKAQRGAQPRLPGGRSMADGPCAVAQVSSAECLSAQRLVAVLAPVLGCDDIAEPLAPATLLWLSPEC